MKRKILIDVKFDSIGQFEPFMKLMPDIQIVNWNDKSGRPDDLSGIQYALGWKADAGLFSKLRDLEVMFSVGAGVDHMLIDPTLPDLPLVRFVDTKLTTRMGEWVCLQCLLHLRQQLTYLRQQSQKLWLDHPQPDAGSLRVGIMGMGVLGQHTAQKLLTLGFQVNGWSKSKKDIEGIRCFDEFGLDQFLAQSDMIVGLLPHTSQTTGIFDQALFSKLPRQTPIGGPVLINGGRGKSQVEADIITALKNGTLGGVSLDVFEHEPLNQQSELWALENVVITPHVASVSDNQSLAEHVAGQIQRFESGLPLQHVVDKIAGY